MEKPKKLQYISDIHLEFIHLKNIPTIEPIEPGNTYLVLCGDIGNPVLPTYKKFLDIHTKLFVHILIVSGNHEYYSSRKKQRTISEIDKLIKQIVKCYSNITYLNMDRLVIGRTKFIGCPLWTDVTMVKELAENVMNDYKNIYVKSDISEGRLVRYNNYNNTKKKYLRPYKSQLRAKDVINLHFKMKEWLEIQINKTNPNKYDDIIVLTHHAPTFKMLHKTDMYSDCYGSDCESLIKKPIKFWISGHTHDSMKCTINETICLSNCMGYRDQKVCDFNSHAYVEFI